MQRGLRCLISWLQHGRLSSVIQGHSTLTAALEGGRKEEAEESVLEG